MNQTVKLCKTHGQLEIKDIGFYASSERNKIRSYCKLCSKILLKKRRDIVKEKKLRGELTIKFNETFNCFKHGIISTKYIYINSYGGKCCKICRRESNIVSDIKWRKPEKERASNLKKTYGITLDQYNLMLQEQNYVCKICKNPETLMRRGKIPPLSVDHCHKSEEKGIIKIRGLLCRKCNSALAMMRDNPEYLREAALYIEFHNNKIKHIDQY